MFNSMKKILIYRNCSLGDFIVSLPAIKMIRDVNPDAKIYFASMKKEVTGYVTPNLLPLKKKIIDKFIFFKYNPLSILNFLLKIREEKFEKLYCLNEYLSNIRRKRDFLIFNLLGIQKLYGFKYEKYNYKNFNETYYLCKRVNENINKKNISFSNLIKKNKFKNYNYITLSMGSRDPNRGWKMDYWESLINDISRHFPNLKIKIVGSKNDIENANKIKKINKKKIINICGKTSVSLLFKVINNSSYHISHNDGTMHVASVFNKNGIAIFGLTDPRGKWFPINKRQKIFFPKKHVNDTKPSLVFKKIYYDLKKLNF